MLGWCCADVKDDLCDLRPVCVRQGFDSVPVSRAGSLREIPHTTAQKCNSKASPLSALSFKTSRTRATVGGRVAASRRTSNELGARLLRALSLSALAARSTALSLAAAARARSRSPAGRRLGASLTAGCRCPGLQRRPGRRADRRRDRSAPKRGSCHGGCTHHSSVRS